MNDASFRPVTRALIALVALEHLWFFVLESFLWTTPLGLQTFNTTPETAATMRVLAFNQGVYNAFLAAALVVGGFIARDARVARALTTFGLVCIVIAGVVGGFTVKPALFGIQGVPAIIALLLVRRDARS